MPIFVHACCMRVLYLLFLYVSVALANTYILDAAPFLEPRTFLAGRVLTDSGDPGEVKYCDVAVCAKRNARGVWHGLSVRCAY